MAKLKYLLSLTPLDSWRLVRRRLPILRNGPAWTAAELMTSSKYGRGIRFAELLLRQESVVRRHGPWEPLNFEDKRVVEIGCGPLGGFGPMAIFCGAESFESAEPEWNGELFFSDMVVDRYLRVFHADLCALFGPRMVFDAFCKALREKLAVHRCGFEMAPIAGPTDIVLSQSCLEHVFPLEATVDRLAEIQTASTRFLHLVDFGNHYPTDNPFEGLYTQPPAAYIATRGKAINLMRAPDIEALFADKGIAAKTIPSRVMPVPAPVHTWWRERYDVEALSTQLALIVPAT